MYAKSVHLEIVKFVMQHVTLCGYVKYKHSLLPHQQQQHWLQQQQRQWQRHQQQNNNSNNNNTQ